MQAGQLMRARAEQGRQIRRLLQYPCLLLILLLGTLGTVKAAILPSLAHGGNGSGTIANWQWFSGITVITLVICLLLVGRPINLRKRKRLPIAMQAKLFETLADLLGNGFSFQQAFQFTLDVEGPAFQSLQPALGRLAAGDDLSMALRISASYQ
ncbi:hypothetical protein WP50_16850 [Lactiplantibacillus plantarum]|nr:hypothetical protein WP50_16850 [Lactiplantibacillus plantarum]